jgi:hypothetical protein
MRMRVWLILVTLVWSAAAGGSLSAQDVSPLAPLAADSANVVPSPLAAWPILQPPPSASPATSPVAALEENGPLPYIFGIFGGIAGMFVADWWADRDCGDSCGQTNIPMLFLGGGLGAIIGYLIGGGELPDDAPPGRWP